MLLKRHFTTNIDLSYTFTLPKTGMKEATVGLMLYNIFSAKYDNNGWAAPAYKQEDGRVVAYNGQGSSGYYRDMYAVGFAPSAPFNMMAHLSVNF